MKDMEVFVDDPRCPPVPRNYKVYQDHDGRFYTMPGPDKRKQQGRVSKDRPKWFLAEYPDGHLVWERPGEYETIKFREFMLKQALETEIKFPGMRMTAKAPKATTILRQEYGMTGTPLALYIQFCKFRSLDIRPDMAERALAEGKVA